MSKTIIVTGGAGYIGSHTVVELIEAGFDPIIIDDFRNSKSFIIDRLEEITGKNILFYAVDCTDEKSVDKIFKDHFPVIGVIHFAAYKAVGESVDEPVKYYQNNIGAMSAILCAMKKNKVEHLVFSSSCTVYGEPEFAEVNEETPIKNAASPYGDTKIVSEKMIRFVLQSKQPIKATLLRYFNPIGAHPSAKIGELPLGVPNNLVPFITQTAVGKRNVLTVFGNDYNTPDGTNIRDYIHVVDLAIAHVEAINWLLKQNESCCEAINLGTGKGTSVLEIINTFEKVNQLKVNYTIGGRRLGDVEQIFANADKANHLLKWKCKYSISDALKHAWEWEKQVTTT